MDIQIKHDELTLLMPPHDEIYKLFGTTAPKGYCILRRRKKGGGALWAKTADAEKCGELTKRIFI